MLKGVAPNPTDQAIDQRRPPQKEKGGIVDYSRSISDRPAAKPRTARQSSDSDTRGQEDERRDPEERGRIKADGGGIRTAMEPFHFDPPDFNPPDGRPREGRDDFPEDESDALAEPELKRRFEAGRAAGGYDPDASGARG